MKRIFIAFAVSGIILSSCGTGKKLDAANQQIQTLNTQVAAQNKQIADNQNALDQLKSQNAQCAKDAADCRLAQEATQQKTDEMNRRAAERDSALGQIRAKAHRALAEFENAGAEVVYKNGMLHISMPEKMVFPPGSTTVSEQGRQALSVVADVMDEDPNITVIVVGNTDSIAIRKTYKDNWSLSTERANAILRILRDKYKEAPERMTAAGKGRYDPIADNSTEEGRAKNRRTDIILNPNLNWLHDNTGPKP